METSISVELIKIGHGGTLKLVLSVHVGMRFGSAPSSSMLHLPTSWLWHSTSIHLECRCLLRQSQITLCNGKALPSGTNHSQIILRSSMKVTHFGGCGSMSSKVSCNFIADSLMVLDRMLDGGLLLETGSEGAVLDP